MLMGSHLRLFKDISTASKNQPDVILRRLKTVFLYFDLAVDMPGT